MSYRADKLAIDGHTYIETDRQTHSHAGNDNTQRPNITSGKNGERIFMKLLGQVAYKTRYKLEQFQDVALNPLDRGSIFLFSGSVLDNKIMEKWVNGFSWKFQDMAGMAQQTQNVVNLIFKLISIFLIKYDPEGQDHRPQ